MAYYETNVQKIKKLIKNPKDNVGKILPFIKSKMIPYHRDLCESFGIEKYSKPYPGHEELLKNITKRNGFFVQCGGNEGCNQDPTYYLEKFRGWKGIIVEPLSISKLCQRNRNKSIVVQNACVSFDYKGDTATLVDCYGMSFIKDSIDNGDEWIKIAEETQKIQHREITVPVRTVQSIIDEYNIKKQSIDLFVADVEGYEIEILKGLDFSKNSPSYILLEIQNSERLKNINEFLESKGYSLINEIDDKNYLFIKKC